MNIEELTNETKQMKLKIINKDLRIEGCLSTEIINLAKVCDGEKFLVRLSNSFMIPGRVYYNINNVENAIISELITSLMRLSDAAKQLAKALKKKDIIVDLEDKQ